MLSTPALWLDLFKSTLVCLQVGALRSLGQTLDGVGAAASSALASKGAVFVLKSDSDVLGQRFSENGPADASL